MFSDGLKHLLKGELHIEIEGYAANGKEAIDKCAKEKFDMVLMDINMPVIDGIHATSHIKQHKPQLKIIMVSMLTDLPSITKALAAGADAYILKSDGIEELSKAFKAVSKNEIYLSSTISHLFTNDTFNKIVSKEQYISFSENLITPREQQILKLIVEGFTDAQIADALFLSDKTVSTHRKNMLAKLGVSNTASLVKFALENKLA
ncbi:MAG: response regulator transcription factor [Bacteroidetes bacterium]|nr:response regulator transcription factor [Bacteroidota bacterium]